MAQGASTIGERFTQPRQLAWRTLSGIRQFNGTPSEELPTLRQAIEDAHLDFNVVVATAEAKMPDGSTIPTDTRFIVREAMNGFKQRVFGTCGPDWRPVQNAQLADLLQPLADEFDLDALGAMDDGTDLVIVFKIETVQINGERVDEYLLVRDSKQFGRALTFRILPVRFKCMNQLQTGMEGAAFTVPIRHSGDVEGGIDLNMDLFSTLQVARQNLHVAFEKMGERVLTDDEVNEVLSRTFPDPSLPKKARALHAVLNAERSQIDEGVAEDETKALSADNRAELDRVWKSYQFYMNRADRFRTDARTVYEEFNKSHPELAGTGWALYQGITEMCCYRNAASDEGLAESILDGDRAKEMAKAFSATIAICAPDYLDAPAYEPGPSTGAAKRPAGEAAKANREKKLAGMTEEQRAEFLAAEQAKVERAQARRNREENEDPEVAIAKANEAARKASAAAERAQARAAQIVARAEEAKAKLAAKRAAEGVTVTEVNANGDPTDGEPSTEGPADGVDEDGDTDDEVTTGRRSRKH